MSIRVIPLASPMEEKIAWAERCFQRLGGAALLQDGNARDMLRRLGAAACSSREQMAHSGVGTLCRSCEEQDGGSCCGAGLENRYSGILLLINLLLGAEIPRERQDPKGCFFLGPKGCRLMARDVLCVNYLCKKVTDGIDPHKIALLREKEGLELGLLFLLNEYIVQFLRSTP